MCNANNTTAKVPCTAPVRDRGRRAGRQRQRRRQPRLRLLRRYVRLLLRRFGRDSLDGAGMDADLDGRLLPAGRPARTTRTRSGTGSRWSTARGSPRPTTSSGTSSPTASPTSAHTSSTTTSRERSTSRCRTSSASSSTSRTPPATTRPPSAGCSPRTSRSDFFACGANAHIVRNMADPPDCGDPDRMGSPLYTADPDETDGGGVHPNSGVNNKAAFLMADGGLQRPDGHRDRDPEGGADLLQVNNSMLGSASDYADLGNALVRPARTSPSATTGSPTADCTEVGQAVLATEMATDPPEAPTPDLPAPSCDRVALVRRVLRRPREPGERELGRGDDRPTASYRRAGFFYPQNPNAGLSTRPTRRAGTEHLRLRPLQRHDSTLRANGDRGHGAGERLPALQPRVRLRGRPAGTNSTAACSSTRPTEPPGRGRTPGRLIPAGNGGYNGTLQASPLVGRRRSSPRATATARRRPTSQHSLVRT